MNKLETKAKVKILMLLAIFVYFASYITRINFGAILVDIIQTENMAKTSVSLITTIGFITYGVGQLISGYLGDLLSPRWLIFSGFMVTIGSNLLMPFVTPRIGWMLVVWGINGLAQAFMWPPLVKILSGALTPEDYDRSVVKICYGSGGGTIAVYLFAPLIIKLSGWRWVFFICAAVAFVVAVLFMIISKSLLKGISFAPVKRNREIQGATPFKLGLVKIINLLLPIMLITIALQGMLRDGISTWVPTFISETFKVESTVSILVGVALPIFHVMCASLTYRVMVWLKNDLYLSINVFFGIIAVLLTVLPFAGQISMWLSLLILSAVNGLLHMINSIQTCYFPRYYQVTGKVSLMSGVFNFGTYIGSALSTYLFAVFSEKWGWNMTIYSWVIVAVLGLILTYICGRKVKNYLRTHHE